MSRYKITDLNGIYFTTHTIVEWLPVFKSPAYFQIIIDSLKYCQKNKGLILFGYVIMLDHIHILAQAEQGKNLQTIFRDFKKFTSKEISSQLEKDNEKLTSYVMRKAAEKEKGKRKYKVWQNEYHPQVVYTPKVCYQKLNYIHNNPVKKRFVSKPEDWLHSSARNYILEDDSIINVSKIETI